MLSSRRGLSCPLQVSAIRRFFAVVDDENHNSLAGYKESEMKMVE